MQRPARLKSSINVLRVTNHIYWGMSQNGASHRVFSLHDNAKNNVYATILGGIAYRNAVFRPVEHNMSGSPQGVQPAAEHTE